MKVSPPLKQSGSKKSRIKMPNVESRRIDSVSEDRFVTIGSNTFAGTHLLLDLWEAKGLDDPFLIEKALRDAVDVSGATLLHLHLHQFTSSGGISGVAVLAESHISVHTWPERNYAAFDLFMCGNAQPELAVSTLQQAFLAGRTEITNIQRGRLRSCQNG